MFHRVRRAFVDSFSALSGGPSSLSSSPNAAGGGGSYALVPNSTPSVDRDPEMATVGTPYRSLGSSLGGIAAPTASTHGRAPGLFGSSSTSPTSIRARLLHLWLYLSPLTTFLLVVLLLRRPPASTPPPPRPRELSETINSYACAPKNNFTALSEICRVEQTKKPDWRQKVDGYELGHDRHFTQQQCDEVFPNLYHEIDRAVKFWKKRGGVTRQDLDDAERKGQARALIINNRLYVKSYSEEQQGTRTKAVLASIRDAMIGSVEPLPDVEFVLQTGDTGIPSGAAWALGRKAKEEQVTLMPDYGFFSWPEPGVGGMVEVADKCKAYEETTEWEDKIPQLFWKGALMVDIRKELWEIARKYSWGAVSDLDWWDKSTIQTAVLTPEQHCGYKYLCHVEGFAYSGRGKQLLQCRSVVVAHQMKYIQHFHHLFNSDADSPEQNIVISPGRNFDKLPETMEWLIQNDERAEQIADNSYNFFRHYLSPASVDCYWRRLIQRWAEVLAFEPELPRDVASYESFILLGKTQWVPY